MHGTWGGKTVNYAPDLNDVDLRFLDGKFMEDRLLELFPEKKSIYYISGYSKLDNYFQLTEEDRIKLSFGYKQKDHTVRSHFLPVIHLENG